MTDKPSRPIGFQRAERCPICGEYHPIEFMYKAMPILVCEKAPKDQVIAFSCKEDTERFLELFEATKRR